jgi:hypothetical protein
MQKSKRLLKLPESRIIPSRVNQNYVHLFSYTLSRFSALFAPLRLD